MARLVAGASGASVQGLREAERCQPDRVISKGSAARRRFHFFSSSRSVFVRPVGSSDVVMPRPASVVVCAGAGRVPCGRLPAPVIPERLRLSRRKSRRVRRLCCPSSGFVAVPVRAGAAGRIRPADCARRSLPNQGRRQCAADASERLPARPGPAGVLRLRSLSGMFFRHRLRASAPTTGRATGKKPSDRRKRGNNGGPTGKSARRMRFFQRGSCSKRKKIVFLFVKTDVIPRRKC